MRGALKGEVIPKEVIDRNDKMAFVTPEALWIKSIIENTDIDYEKLPSWINNTELQSWLKLKMNQTQLDQSVWRFICFYRWIEVFDVSIQ
jgi:asparagine synthase (glutamine-hydrolysing)